MLTFQEWVKATNPAVAEGLWDTAKSLGKKAAIGGALMGAGAGLTYLNNPKLNNAQTAISPDAADFLPDVPSKQKMKQAAKKQAKQSNGIGSLDAADFL